MQNTNLEQLKDNLHSSLNQLKDNNNYIESILEHLGLFDYPPTSSVDDIKSGIEIEPRLLKTIDNFSNILVVELERNRKNICLFAKLVYNSEDPLQSTHSNKVSSQEKENAQR